MTKEIIFSGEINHVPISPFIVQDQRLQVNPILLHSDNHKNDPRILIFNLRRNTCMQQMY